MSPIHDDALSMRERQIMDAVYRLGQASVAEIRDELPNPPSTNAVRTMLGLLAGKGLLRKSFRGRAAIYRPALSQDRAARKALQRVLDIFHRGSLASALAVHLSDPKSRPSEAELAEIRRLLAARRGANDDAHRVD